MAKCKCVGGCCAVCDPDFIAQLALEDAEDAANQALEDQP